MPKVSIIVPVYNVSAYLAECLDSIHGQTLQDWEAILVDDGSTDTSGTICDDYAARDSRFRVIRKENGGAASAKNAGLDLATGQYIAFIDSDDLVEENWLQILVDTVQSQNAQIVECRFDRLYTDGSQPVSFGWDQLGAISAEEYLNHYLGEWTCSLFWLKLFQAELLRDIRFRRERRCIDDEFFTYKAIAGAEKIVRIDNVLYHYRQRMSSAVQSEKNRRQITDDSLEILIERYQWVSERYPSLRKIYLRHDVEIMFYFAADFLFCNETVKKFRKVAAFYLGQCFLHFPGRVTMLYALRLLFMKKSRLLHGRTQRKSNMNNLFP